MADLIGELGLDVAEIQKALGLVNKQLDGLQNAADKTRQATSKIEKGFTGLIKNAKELAGVLGVAFGVRAIVDYFKSFQNLHAEIQKTRSELAAGSVDAAKFGAAVDSIQGGEASGLAFKEKGNAISNFMTSLKERIALMTRQAEEGVSRSANPFAPSDKDGGAMKTPETLKKEAEDAYNQETVDRGKKIVELQHALVDAHGQDLSVVENQLKALKAEANLHFAIMEYSARTGVSDEAARAAAIRGYAAANTAFSNAELQAKNELRIQKATSDEMLLKRAGYEDIGKQEKIIAEYETKILQARREGKKALEQQLIVQRDISIEAGKVAEHNKTPKERHDERAAARKFARDVEKAEAHNLDMERRLHQNDLAASGSHMSKSTHMGSPTHMTSLKAGEGIMVNGMFSGLTHKGLQDPPGPKIARDGITPGSEMDRFQRLKAAQGGGNRDVGVRDSIKAEKFYTQGLADLDAIKTNFDSAFQNR